MLYRGRFINAMPQPARVLPIVNHDLDASQAALRARSLVTPVDGPVFDRTARGL